MTPLTYIPQTLRAPAKATAPEAGDTRIDSLAGKSLSQLRHMAWILSYDVTKQVKVGMALPDIRLYGVGGEECRISHFLNNKPVVLNFGSLT